MTGQYNIQFSIDYELDSLYDMIDRVEISYNCGFGNVVGLVVQSPNGNTALNTPYLGVGFRLDSRCNNNPNIIITISQIAFGIGTIYFNFENACLGSSINTGTLSPTIEPTIEPTMEPTSNSLGFLNCGDTIIGDTSLPDNFEDRFLFRLDFPGIITFSSCGSSFDTFARIYDINGNQIATRYVLSIFNNLFNNNVY